MKTIENAIYYYDYYGNLTYVEESGKKYHSREILTYMVQKKVDEVSFLSAINTVLDPPEAETNINHKYDGPYRGLGLGGSNLFPHSGFFDCADYLNWMQNNPEEVQRMQNQWYNYLNGF